MFVIFIADIFALLKPPLEDITSLTLLHFWIWRMKHQIAFLYGSKKN